MPRRDAARVLRRRHGRGPGATDGDRRLAIRRKTQIVRILLFPLESRPFSINPQPSVVLVSCSHLARPQHSSRTALKSQEHLHVVVKPPPRHEYGNFRRHLIAAKSSHKTRDVVCVRSDIPKGTGRSALRRIGAPKRLLVPSSLDRRGPPTPRPLPLPAPASPPPPPPHPPPPLPTEEPPRTAD